MHIIHIWYLRGWDGPFETHHFDSDEPPLSGRRFYFWFVCRLFNLYINSYLFLFLFCFGFCFLLFCFGNERYFWVLSEWRRVVTKRITTKLNPSHHHSHPSHLPLLPKPYTQQHITHYFSIQHLNFHIYIIISFSSLFQNLILRLCLINF